MSEPWEIAATWFRGALWATDFPCWLRESLPHCWVASGPCNLLG